MRWNASCSSTPSRVMRMPLARSTSLRVSSVSLRLPTSCCSVRSSANRAIAISMAGTSSASRPGLTRYASTPASCARCTRSRSLHAVRRMIGFGARDMIVAAAEMPSSPGILMSMKMRSGAVFCASVTASSPSGASPTTLYPCSSSMALRPMRITGSSSAIRILSASGIVLRPGGGARHRDDDAGPAGVGEPDPALQIVLHQRADDLEPQVARAVEGKAVGEADTVVADLDPQRLGAEHQDDDHLALRPAGKGVLHRVLQQLVHDEGQRGGLLRRQMHVVAAHPRVERSEERRV